MASSNKIVLAFYYPWYGNTTVYGQWVHWNYCGHDPDTITNSRRDIDAAHYPSIGAYDSNDMETLRHHVRIAKNANIDGFISSWWGINTFEDVTFQKLLDVSDEENFNVSVYLEIVENNDADNAIRDLKYILDNYGTRSSFMKYNGKPVVFVYSTALTSITPSEWSYVVESLTDSGYSIFLVAESRGVDTYSMFDGYHMYIYIPNHDTLDDIYNRLRQEAHSVGKLFAATVKPGFDDSAEHHPECRSSILLLDRENGNIFTGEWDTSIKNDADWILITSFNEWHEGTEIEPSLQFGNQYLDLTQQKATSFKEVSDIKTFSEDFFEHGLDGWNCMNTECQNCDCSDRTGRALTFDGCVDGDPDALKTFNLPTSSSIFLKFSATGQGGYGGLRLKYSCAGISETTLFDETLSGDWPPPTTWDTFGPFYITSCSGKETQLHFEHYDGGCDNEQTHIDWISIFYVEDSDEEPDSCSETDGGDKPKDKGTVSGYQDGGEYSHTDECLSSLNLREYYCVGDSWTSKTYNCWDYYGSRNYCYFGVCKKIGGGGRAGKKSLTEITLAPIAIAVVVILIVFGALKFFAKK